MEKIEDKIRKLLALTASPNIQEATVALAKAHSLLIQYNLNINDVINNIKSDIIEEPFMTGNKPRQWRLSLIQMIAKYNYCQVCNTIIKDKGFILSIIGHEYNVTATKLMGTYILDAIESQAKKYMTGKRHSAIESFKVGFSVSIVERLEQLRQIELNNNNTKELIVIEDNKIEESLKENTKVVSTVNINDINNYVQGRIKGNKLSLNNQIENEEKLKIE